MFFRYLNVDKRSNILNKKLPPGFKSLCIEQLHKLNHHEEGRVTQKQKLWHLDIDSTNGNLAIRLILGKKTSFPNGDKGSKYNEIFVPNGDNLAIH